MKSEQCYETRKKQFQRALSKVWRIANEHGIPLHTATGFFTALDWQQIADEEIAEAGIEHVMVEIAANPAFLAQINEEYRR